MHAVVEPWFLGAGAGKAGSEAFKELQATTKGVHFCASVVGDGGPNRRALASVNVPR